MLAGLVEFSGRDLGSCRDVNSVGWEPRTQSMRDRTAVMYVGIPTCFVTARTTIGSEKTWIESSVFRSDANTLLRSSVDRRVKTRGYSADEQPPTFL